MSEEEKEPITKYLFKDGRPLKKIKKYGWKFKGRGKIGKLKNIKADGIKFYYVEYDFGRSNLSKYKKNFKKVEYWEEDFNWQNDYIEKKKPKKKLTFETKISTTDGILSGTQIKLGKHDCIHFFNLDDSNIIRDLQLKEDDKLIVTMEKRK